MSVYKVIAPYQATECSVWLPCLMKTILSVQFCASSKVRTIVEIYFFKAGVFSFSLTLIKHRSGLCAKIIHYPVTTFFFFFFLANASVWVSIDIIKYVLITHLLCIMILLWILRKSVVCNLNYLCPLLSLLIKLLEKTVTNIQQPSSPWSCPTTHLSCPD